MIYEEDVDREAKMRGHRALELLEKNTVVKQALTLEPRLYDVLSEINAVIVVENRDQAYKEFKNKCIKLVGFDAEKLELRTQHHYVNMMDFIGTLISWVEEQPRPRDDIDDFYDDEDNDINVAVKRSIAESQAASLDAFKELARGSSDERHKNHSQEGKEDS